MKVENKALDNLALLASIQLSEKEKDSLLSYLKETLSHFENIKDIDTKGIEPLISPFSPTLKLREDKVVDFLDKEDLLEQAPERQGNLFKVLPFV